MKKVIFGLLALTTVTVGCDRNSIKSRSFADRTLTLEQELKAINAEVLAKCTEKAGTQNKIQIAIYKAIDATGVEFTGVKGSVRVLPLNADAQDILNAEINEKLKAEDATIVNTEKELLIVKNVKPAEGQDVPMSPLYIKITAEKTDARIVLDADSIVTGEDISCTRTPSAAKPSESFE